jgi:hypothetical protein
MRFLILPREAGKGDHPKRAKRAKDGGRGVSGKGCSRLDAPSTTLRVVPLPHFAGADEVASAASLTVHSVEGSSALAVTLRRCRLRSHFDFVLREFVAQRHCHSQRLDKPFVRRLNVPIKLDDKELMVENVKTIVLAHGTPPGVTGHRSQAGLLVGDPHASMNLLIFN